MRNQLRLLSVWFVGIIFSCHAGECLVFGQEPLLQWRFDGAASPGQWLGDHGTPAEGPRSPKYPDFSDDNQSMAFAGHDGAILIKDHERGGFANVRFAAGRYIWF